MTEPVTGIVFDSTSFIHFARAGRLAILQQASGDDEAVLLTEVEVELARGAPLLLRAQSVTSSARECACLLAAARTSSHGHDRPTFSLVTSDVATVRNLSGQ